MFLQLFYKPFKARDGWLPQPLSNFLSRTTVKGSFILFGNIFQEVNLIKTISMQMKDSQPCPLALETFYSHWRMFLLGQGPGVGMGVWDYNADKKRVLKEKVQNESYICVAIAWGLLMEDCEPCAKISQWILWRIDWEVGSLLLPWIGSDKKAGYHVRIKAAGGVFTGWRRNDSLEIIVWHKSTPFLNP